MFAGFPAFDKIIAAALRGHSARLSDSRNLAHRQSLSKKLDWSR
jgi:hypothetical protein